MKKESKIKAIPVKFSRHGHEFHAMRNVVIVAWGWFDACSEFKKWALGWLADMESEEAGNLFLELSTAKKPVDTFRYDGTTYTIRGRS